MTEAGDTSRTPDPLDRPAGPGRGSGQEPPPGREPAHEGGGAWSALGARGLSAALKPLAALAGMADDIKAMTSDVKRMADSTSTLPEVTETLNAIRAHVERLDREVYEMHAAVEDMKAMLEPLSGQLQSVSRLTNRLPGGRKYRRAQGEQAESAAAEAPPE